VQVSEQCDRCGKVCTQDVHDGDTIRSKLKAFWGVCRMFGDPKPAGQPGPKRVVVPAAYPRYSEEGLRQRAYKAVAEATRICDDCVRDYRERHTEFAIEWFTSHQSDA
jgi:hypothetical protein